MLSTLLYMKRSEILMIKIIKMLQKRLKMVKSSLCNKHKHYTTCFYLLYAFRPALIVFNMLSTLLYMKQSEILMIKIIKDWKLSNPSIHPILQAKQPIWQANNPFYTVFKPILHSFWTCCTLKVTTSKRSKWGEMDDLGLILGQSPPTGYIRVPMGYQ